VSVRKFGEDDLAMLMSLALGAASGLELPKAPGCGC
jgi:hypothetical protein